MLLKATEQSSTGLNTKFVNVESINCSSVWY